MPEIKEGSLTRREYSLKIFDLAARWYVFIFLNNYGLGKIAGGQFYRRGHLPHALSQTALKDVPAFDLAWTFMGYSFAYILFIGLAEILGAWLLLWDRTKLIGVAILLPVMVNILVFDLIFLDEYGALASATIYTLLLFVILFCNRERVVKSFQAAIAKSPALPVPFRQKAFATGMAVLAMGALLVVDQILVHLFGYGRG